MCCTSCNSQLVNVNSICALTWSFEKYLYLKLKHKSSKHLFYMKINVKILRIIVLREDLLLDIWKYLWEKCFAIY